MPPRTPERTAADVIRSSRSDVLDARTRIPERPTLEALRAVAAGCQACPLFGSATQTVFGEGPADARVMLVGEQAGDSEDREGRPFVGQAGRVLDRALEAAGIDRGTTYITNVVKHFKWVAKGKRRLHQKPNAREIGACIPWLETEIEIIKPEVIVALGSTAAQALFGKEVRVTRDRGQILATRRGRALLTMHPASILRMPTLEYRELATRDLVADLERVAEALRGR